MGNSFSHGQDAASSETLDVLRVRVAARPKRHEPTKILSQRSRGEETNKATEQKGK